MNTTLLPHDKLFFNAAARLAGKTFACLFNKKLLTLFLLTALFDARAFGQAPTVHYSSPHTYLTGTPIAPLAPTSTNVAVQAYNQTTVNLGSGFGYTSGVAKDAAGNVYVADPNNHSVWEIPVGGGGQVSIGSGFSSPFGVAVDAAGNIYVADDGNSAVYKVPAGGGSIVTIASGLNSPESITVDAMGNVYVASTSGIIYKILTGSTNPVVISTIGGSQLFGIAVDAADNLYVADELANAIKEIPVGGGTVFTVASGLNFPAGVAVDAAGNLYEAEVNSGLVKEIPAGSSSPVVIASGLSYPEGIAIDPAGNVYAAGHGSVTKLKPLGGYYTGPFLPAGLTVNTTTGVISGTPTAATAAANYTVTAYNSTGASKTAVVNIAVKLPRVILTILTAGQFAISPVFASATSTYSTAVGNGTSSITVTPTANMPDAVITVQGQPVVSGSASPSIPLTVGNTSIPIVVTAVDHSSTITYYISVNRARSSDPRLFSIKTSAGLAIGTTVPTSVTENVPNGTSSITITPTANDPNTNLTINGLAVTSGSASQSIALNTGSNIITVVCKAQNDSTLTYQLVVNRAPSSNNALFSIKTSAGLARGKTVPTTLTENVVNATSTITVTPTVDYPTATVTVNGITVTSGTASAVISLVTGDNTITTVVTAQNGASQTYTLMVMRAGKPVADNTTYQPVSVDKPTEQIQLADDGINVHQGVSPNGDGINDYLQIDNISLYPDNNLKIMNRNGLLVYEEKGYNNATKAFDGHSNKNGQMQLPGTYFYSLDYTVNGLIKHKSGFIVLKY